MPELSACIIARNEEQHIGHCLDSVAGIADELVVVDTGSADATTSIAEAHGAKVYHHSWSDDFSAVRNFALGQASGEWVLQLDADERLYAGDRDLVRELIANQAIDAYMCQVVNLAAPDSFEGATIHAYRRLFRRDSYRYSGTVHEQVVPMPTTRGTTSWSAIHIVHWGYLDPDVMAAKSKRNQAMLRRAIDETPNDPYLYFYLGREHVNAGELDKAVDAYTEAEARRGPGDHGFLALVINERCDCLKRLGRLDEALEQLDSARQYFFDYRDMHYLAGEIYAAKGDRVAALACFEMCSNMPDVSPRYLAAKAGLDLAARRSMGVCLRNLGREAEAAERFKECLASNPSDGFSFFHLAHILLAAEKLADVHKKLARLADWQSAEIQAIWHQLAGGA